STDASRLAGDVLAGEWQADRAGSRASSRGSAGCLAGTPAVWTSGKMKPQWKTGVRVYFSPQRGAVVKRKGDGVIIRLNLPIHECAVCRAAEPPADDRRGVRV